MALEDQLSSWTGPSSPTEQEKQERTERMIRQAVDEHPAFAECSLRVYVKGSYANNTNVRADSDVDISVECTEVEYWEEAEAGAHPAGERYEGIWTPEKLRGELEAALRSKFPGQVDASGSTAINIASNTARVEADVVPCFSYRYYLTLGSRAGVRIFKRDGTSLVNYPAQQLENGRAKNNATNTRFKKAVRILKRVANKMEEEAVHRAVPSYFVECLVYNCPNSLFAQSSWTEIVRGILVHVWQSLQGDEPTDESSRWLEVNSCFFLFHGGQEWDRADGREFAYASWNYLV